MYISIKEWICIEFLHNCHVRKQPQDSSHNITLSERYKTNPNTIKIHLKAVASRDQDAFFSLEYRVSLDNRDLIQMQILIPYVFYWASVVISNFLLKAPRPAGSASPWSLLEINADSQTLTPDLLVHNLHFTRSSGDLQEHQHFEQHQFASIQGLFPNGFVSLLKFCSHHPVWNG